VGTIEVEGREVPILDAIDSAYLADDLSGEQRDRLVNSSRRTRFGAARDRLQRKFTGPAGGPLAQESFSSAMDEFMEWEQRNQNASAEEAMDKANELGRRWEFMSTEDLTLRLPVPTGSTRRPTTLVEVEAARAALRTTVMERHGLTAASPREQIEAILDADEDYDRDGDALDEYERIFQKLENPPVRKPGGR
jgi:hypothetical protein